MIHLLPHVLEKHGSDSKLGKTESQPSTSHMSKAVRSPAPVVMVRNVYLILYLWTEILVDWKSVGGTLFSHEKPLLVTHNLKNKWTLNELNAHKKHTESQMKNCNYLAHNSYKALAVPGLLRERSHT